MQGEGSDAGEIGMREGRHVEEEGLCMSVDGDEMGMEMEGVKRYLCR